MTMADTIYSLKTVLEENRDHLEQTKVSSEKWGAHPDWPWNGIILSAATRGGSKRWEQRVAPRYEAELSWSVLGQMSSGERRQRLETVGRFWKKTADWLECVYDDFAAKGGPKVLREIIAEMDSPAVLTFWTTFPNIGEKYARNLMMDIYDPRFRSGFFAVDSRIKKLLPKIGYEGRNRYQDQEAFLNDLAYSMNIEAWDLDRLLYHAHERILRSFPD